MPLWILNIPSLLGKVPREVWYVIGALLAWWFFSSHYIEQGREEVLTELRTKAAEAAEKAAEAETQADDNATERAEDFEREQEVLEEAINEAVASDGNALDAIF